MRPALCTLTTALLTLRVFPVLFLYESFVVTLDREVASFWTAKWAGAPLLFFANKWISIAISVMSLVSYASLPSNEVSELAVCPDNV